MRMTVHGFSVKTIITPLHSVISRVTMVGINTVRYCILMHTLHDDITLYDNLINYVLLLGDIQ